MEIKDIEKLATLARIELTDQEKEARVLFQKIQTMY
jgi:Asp-tRNA(Asn)/Glu-tRNA(Gln) amidotransferase C subunit